MHVDKNIEFTEHRIPAKNQFPHCAQFGENIPVPLCTLIMHFNYELELEIFDHIFMKQEFFQILFKGKNRLDAVDGKKKEVSSTV